MGYLKKCPHELDLPKIVWFKIIYCHARDMDGIGVGTIGTRICLQILDTYSHTFLDWWTLAIGFILSHFIHAHDKYCLSKTSYFFSLSGFCFARADLALSIIYAKKKHKAILLIISWPKNMPVCTLIKYTSRLDDRWSVECFASSNSKMLLNSRWFCLPIQNGIQNVQK